VAEQTAPFSVPTPSSTVTCGFKDVAVTVTVPAPDVVNVCTLCEAGASVPENVSGVVVAGEVVLLPQAVAKPSSRMSVASRVMSVLLQIRQVAHTCEGPAICYRRVAHA
jgi:hypothetical protein